MRTLRLWLIAGTCVSGLLLSNQPVWAADPSDGLSSRARSQIEALARAKANRTPDEAKIESSLLTASQIERGRALPGGVRIQSGVKTDATGRARIVIRGKVTPAVLDRVRALGGVVRSNRPEDGVVSADVPLGNVVSLGELDEVKSVSSLASRYITSRIALRQPEQSKQERDRQVRLRLRNALKEPRVAGSVTTTGGSVVSEGDKVHGTDRARSTLKLSGVGITVGVLSDGVDSLATSVETGDLPPDVNVLAAGIGDEGTAILEIVHDLAPKAKLAFATVNDTEEDFAAHIRALRAAGADIIVDDILYFAESPFQDGPVAQAVTDVTRDGALYFSSAGNEGNVNDGTSGNYEGTYRSSGRTIGKFAGSAHDFKPGRGVQMVNPTTAGSAGDPAILQWADPLGRAGNDYDLYALDTLGNVVGFSNSVQDGDDLAFEGFYLPNTGGPVHLAVVKFKGANRYFQLTAFRGRFAKDGELKAYVSPGVIRGHATVPSAYSVAGAPAHVPLPIDLEPGDPANPSGPFPGLYSREQRSERFTADGPRRIFFRADGTPLTPGNFTSTGGRVRTDPDITAADGVRTSTTGFDPFFGTSASAPHAAAIAALALSGRPGLTASNFRSALRKTALDIELPGADRDTGRGIIMAEPVLEAVGARAQSFASAGPLIVTSTTDGNTFLEPGERAAVSVPVTNTGDVTARSVSVSLQSSTPGVRISPLSQSYGSIRAGGEVRRPFAVTVARSTPLGARVALTARVTFEGAFSPQTRVGSVVVGEPSPTATDVAYSGPPVAIPDDAPEGVTVSIPVAGVGAVSKATFSVDGTSCDTTAGSTTAGLDHTFVGDLVGTLTSPNGTAIQLFGRVGGGGHNICQAVFADSADRPIGSAAPEEAPFTGSWRPTQPLSTFEGTAGDGDWTFNVADLAGADVGSVRELSIHLNGYVAP
jgi:subtilisin-like proprotein convertase family protein